MLFDLQVHQFYFVIDNSHINKWVVLHDMKEHDVPFWCTRKAHPMVVVYYGVHTSLSRNYDTVQ